MNGLVCRQTVNMENKAYPFIIFVYVCHIFGYIILVMLAVSISLFLSVFLYRYIYIFSLPLVAVQSVPGTTL